MRCSKCGKKWGFGAERPDKTEWLDGDCDDCRRKAATPECIAKGCVCRNAQKTMRDDFATAALTALIGPGLTTKREDLARGAYAYADAMLEARK